MTLAVMQPYFFPYIGYWQLMNSVDTFVIYDDVNYIKKGYINRNFILINNESKLFTLELIKASQNKLINEIIIGNNSSKILKMIQRTYSKAPYYELVYPILVEILTQKETGLAKFIAYSLKLIAKYLQIEINFIYSSDLNKNNSLKSQDKITDICITLGADRYINPIGGMELYDKCEFKKSGIELNFLQTKLIEYKQFKEIFVPNLSIIDIMMFNEVKDIAKMLDKYNLI